jgi:isopropylmalate/homocitrate/citramalate synthase
VSEEGQIEEARANPVSEEQISAFVDTLLPTLSAKVNRFCADAYEAILCDVQEYLRDNAVFNIGSAFDASERDRVQAYKAHKAVLDATSLQEAKSNARAATLGYWSPDRAAEYHAEAVAAKARGAS